MTGVGQGLSPPLEGLPGHCWWGRALRGPFPSRVMVMTRGQAPDGLGLLCDLGHGTQFTCGLVFSSVKWGKDSTTSLRGSNGSIHEKPIHSAWPEAGPLRVSY